MQQENQSESQDSETTRSQWTSEQRVNAGQMAAQALNSPIFSVVHDLLSQKYYRSWLMSEAKEMKTRESNWYRQVALTDLMKESLKLLKGKIDVAPKEALEGLNEFFRGRLQNQFTGRGSRHDLVQAVLEDHWTDPVDSAARLDALSKFSEKADFADLMLSFKRVMSATSFCSTG